MANDPYKSLLKIQDADNIQPVAREEPHSPVSKGQTKLCMFPFDMPFVGINGNVGLCCSSTGRHVVMGNSDNPTFEAVWYGENYRKLRRNLLTGKNLPQFCSKCPRVPNVHPKTMLLHIALFHAMMSIGHKGLLIVLLNLHNYPRYKRQLQELSYDPVPFTKIMVLFFHKLKGKI